MRLFINEILVHVKDSSKYFHDRRFDNEVREPQDLSKLKLHGNVIIYANTAEFIFKLINLMEVKKLKKVLSIIFVTDDYDGTKELIKGRFKVIKAGGGLVVKKGKALLIYRLGRWDLPKGKLEKDETTIEGAVREVEEECCIKVEAKTKICSTWHTYIAEGKKTIKKTTWYLMDCLDDTMMKPQVEEGIHDLRWMNDIEYNYALKQSYASIIEVFKSYNLMKEKTLQSAFTNLQQNSSTDF